MSKIKVFINTEEKEIDEGTTIKDILAKMNIKSPMIAVEKNLAIVPKNEFDSVLKEQDKLEIVEFCGGG
jgi:sulfur carrier protein